MYTTGHASDRAADALLLQRAGGQPKLKHRSRGRVGDKGEVAPTVPARILAVAFGTVGSVGDGA